MKNLAFLLENIQKMWEKFWHQLDGIFLNDAKDESPIFRTQVFFTSRVLKKNYEIAI